eukprot:gene8750-8841_t
MHAEAQMDLETLRRSADSACRLMKVLSNPDRLLLLCQLTQGEKRVGELEELVGISQPTLSQQLGVLREEGLVNTRRDGKNIYYEIASPQALAVMNQTMLIDWTHFTPWAALAGGVLLGLASALFVLLNGRILGISGIVGGLLRPRAGDMGWRLAFVLGMLVAPGLYWLMVGPTQPRIDANWGMVVIAGLLVGVGTRYGSGCTSGHGVCGLSRMSPRSLVATLAFMGAGFVTVFLLRHALA